MGMVTTIQKFCYIECDLWGCGKKIEKNQEDTLTDFAKICGWQKKRKQWICPDCKKKELEFLI